MPKATASLDDFLEAQLADPVVRTRALAVLLKLELGLQVAALRRGLRLSRAAFARRIRSTPRAVARMESGEYRGLTITRVLGIALATGATVDLRFVPVTRQRRQGGKGGRRRRTTAGHVERR
jgi:hypothetical protein